jgi:UDP-N-acetyl-D-mannosaminuronic acid dehydrogenase
MNLKPATAGILGMTFKADSDDPRDSLSFKLKKGLEVECREVLCADPHLDAPGLTPVDEAVRRAGVIFIGTPHTVFRDYDFGSKPVVDIWRSTRQGVSIL